jgi:hypothetical protein
MRILDERYALYKTRVKLGAFGGLSWKGLKLAGAWGGIELLEMVYQLLWPHMCHRQFVKISQPSGKWFG